MSKETHEKYDSNLEKQETKYTDKVADSLFVS